MVPDLHPLSSQNSLPKRDGNSCSYQKDKGKNLDMRKEQTMKKILTRRVESEWIRGVAPLERANKMQRNRNSQGHVVEDESLPL